MSSITILATLALARPMNESGPVWSAIMPTLMGACAMQMPPVPPTHRKPAFADHIGSEDGCQTMPFGSLIPVSDGVGLCRETELAHNSRVGV